MNAFVKRLITGIGLAALFYFLISVNSMYTTLILAGVLGIILTFEWPHFIRTQPWMLLLTPLYPVAPFIALILLNQDPAGRLLLVLGVIAAAAHDIGSYIGGNLFGRNPIAPTISPKKTWEGFFCGCILNVFVLYVFCIIVGKSFDWYVLLGSALSLSVTAFFGDLFESLLKRKAGLKDSGLLLPGHGGFLDRFDSIMTVGLLLYFLKNYFIEKLFFQVSWLY